MTLYGITELARVTGHKAGTLRQWHARGKLPTPLAVLAMGPVWGGKEIEEWIRDHDDRP